eukprot:scaffold206314_cov20-Tisochrysis_lutea.AAC.1
MTPIHPHAFPGTSRIILKDACFSTTEEFQWPGIVMGSSRLVFKLKSKVGDKPQKWRSGDSAA